MTTQAQTVLQQSVGTPVAPWCEPDDGETQMYRAGAYGMLAALLCSSPTVETLARVAGLGKVSAETELAVAMSALGLAADRTVGSGLSLDDEYHALFIGLGRGELVPYGSWYLAGFLMEKPLGQLRDDLAGLGYKRNPVVHEPEDHIAALCEVMSLMIAESVRAPADVNSLARQADFFDVHISSWAGQFFNDLSEASAAVFFRSVGRFGAAVMRFEQQYLAMKV